MNIYKSTSLMDLKKFEFIGSAILWIGAIVYSIYAVFTVSAAFKYIPNEYGDFEEGWLVSNRKKDVSDIEWKLITDLYSKFYLWLIVYLVVSEFLRQTYHKVVPYWQIFIGLLFTTYTTGLSGLILICGQPLLWFLFFHKYAKRIFYIWVFGAIILTIVTFGRLYHEHIHSLNFLGDLTKYVTIMYIFTWGLLRCISYCVDTRTSKHSIIDFLWYYFYIPTFFGPVILFESFIKCQKPEPNRKPLKIRLIGLICSLVRFGFWLIFLEFALHYIYCNAMQYQEELVQSFDNWTLYGYGYCIAQFMHIKYVVIYGISASITTFEHINSPSTPKCIGCTHLVSDRWRSFDVGLYIFLKKYIYIPSVEKSKSKMISSFLVFLFVFVWHGFYYHILVWTLMNFMGLLLEQLLKDVCNSKIMSIVINPTMKDRCFSILNTPLFVISSISNFYFLSNIEIGNIFIKRIFSNTMQATFLLLFFIYCLCILSSTLTRKERHKSYIYKK